jgi:hypothetical protein
MGNDCCTYKNVDPSRGSTTASVSNMEGLFSLVSGPGTMSEMDMRRSRLKDMVHQGGEFRKEVALGFKKTVFVWVDRNNTRLYWAKQAVADPTRGFDGSADLRSIQTVQAGGNSRKAKKLGLTLVSGSNTMIYFECKDTEMRDSWVRGLKLVCELIFKALHHKAFSVFLNDK